MDNPWSGWPTGCTLGEGLPLLWKLEGEDSGWVEVIFQCCGWFPVGL